MSWECWDAGSIPSLAQWVKDLVLQQLWLRLHLWLRSDPWPRSSICQSGQKRKKEYRSFAFLSRLIPRYFILFDVIENGIVSLISVSLISLSDLLLLVYRNATDFYVLTLYPAALPNSWMKSRSFLVASLGYFYVYYQVICKH